MYPKATQPCDDPDEDFRSAAKWMLQLQQPDVDSTTLRGFAIWLEESPDHRQAYARCEALWEIVRQAS